MRWLRHLMPTAHVGVAFGRRWINLCLLVRRGDGYLVAAVEALPAARRNDLASAVDRLGGAGLPATFALPDAEVRRQILHLPPVPARDLARVVAREAELEPGDARAWRVASGADGGGPAIEVRSMPRATVRTLVQEASAAGLVLTDVVSHSGAFATVTARPGAAPGVLLSLVEVWDHTSNMVLARDGAHVYDRSLPRGFHGRTGGPTGTAAADAAPPETVAPAPATDDDVLDFGDVFLDQPEDAVPETAAAEAAPAAAEAPPAVPGPEVLLPEWERLAEELHRTHLFAKKNLKVGDVGRVIVAGPHAEDERFVAWLAERMRAEAVPLVRHRDDLRWPGAPDPRMALPLGAALGGLARAPARARLVPAELRRREMAPPVSYAAAALLVFALVSAGLSVLFEARALARQEADLARLRHDVAGAEEAVHSGPARPLVGPDGVRRTVPAGLAAPFPGTDLLAVVGAAMPADAYLSEAEAAWTDGAWRVTARGEVLVPGVRALRQLGALVAALDASGRFTRVDLSPVTAGEASTPFTVTLVLGGARADRP